MKNLEHLLHQDESVNRVFTPLPMVSYCSARKLTSYLVRAKIYPLERKRGSYKCGKYRFALRWNNCRESNMERVKRLGKNLSKSTFLSDNHQSFEEDVSICLIDKAEPSDPHKSEYYWMRTLKTIAPFGLNTEETY